MAVTHIFIMSGE